MGLTFDLDGGAAANAALGVIVLQSDESLEPELRQLAFGDGTALFHSRIPSSHEVTPETLNQMASDLPSAAALLPEKANFRAIAYGCTSGATVIGPERVTQLVQTHHPSAACTNPMSALLAACSALAVKRIALLTPYIESVSAALRTYLENNGIEIVEFRSFEQKDEATVARISESSVLDALCGCAGCDVDAVFTSCTNLRSFSIIEQAEAHLGVPVLSSNQVLGWHLMQLAGLDSRGAGPGRLFAQP